MLNGVLKYGSIIFVVWLIIHWIISSINQTTSNISNGFNTDLNQIINGQKNFQNSDPPLQLFNNTNQAIVSEAEKGLNFVGDLFSAFALVIIIMGVLLITFMLKEKF